MTLADKHSMIDKHMMTNIVMDSGKMTSQDCEIFYLHSSFPQIHPTLYRSHVIVSQIHYALGL